MKHLFLSVLLSLLLAVLLLFPAAAAAEGGDAFTDVVVLSTTDMHGKCWHTNLLTGSAIYVFNFYEVVGE